MLLDEPKHPSFYPDSSPLLAPHADILGKLTENKGDIVVEAAGVEPASEKARNEENYVRSTIQQLQLPPQNRQEWRPPSPIDLGLMLRTEALQPIPLYDAHSPPRGLDGWSGYLIN